LALAAAGCVLGGLLPAARAAATDADQAPLMEIDVRSTSDKPFGKISFKRTPPVVHGKVYAIAEIKEAPGPQNLVRPVNERALLVELHKELLRRGFRAMNQEQKPDIIVTVMYGRGALRNPYLADATVNEIMSDPPMVTILGAFPMQLIKEHEAGFEAKLQKAQFEKLFIRISAWKYPESPREKPKNLWKTTILVDDPDHRDLNLVYKDMLAAGSPYFDHEIDREEVEVTTRVPEGHVELGTPTVVRPTPIKP
jgi:hypothetical protein